MQVIDDGVQVEAVEFLGVVERLAHGIGQDGVLVENVKVQPVRPPVTVRQCAATARERALAFTCHVVSDRVPQFGVRTPTGPRYRSVAMATRRDLSTTNPAGARDMGRQRGLSRIRIIIIYSKAGVPGDDVGP